MEKAREEEARIRERQEGRGWRSGAAASAPNADGSFGGGDNLSDFFAVPPKPRGPGDQSDDGGDFDVFADFADYSPPKGNEVDGRGRRGGAGRQGSRGFGGPGKGVGGAGRAGDGDVAARKFMETDRALFERDPEDAAFR